jgi:acetolactate synthase-1/2/3 large subunit
MQVLGDLETGVRYDLPVVVVVYNDASYGIIRHRQEREFGRETGASYDTVDFASVARDVGALGVTVRSIEDLAAVEDFVASDTKARLVADVRTIPAVSRPGFPPY